MIFNVGTKQVEIKAAKRFRLIPGGDFSAPGHILINWLGVMAFIKPATPNHHNQAIWREYIVTLKDGKEYQVKATNEYHAGSVVVYGNFNGRTIAIDRNTGKPFGYEVMVHRDNIASIHLKPNS